VSQFVGGYPKEAYDMAQVPERNPARVYENAYAGSGYGQPAQEPEDFEAQMAELQQLLSEASYAHQNRLLAVR
jgi:hypothetical protein